MYRLRCMVGQGEVERRMHADDRADCHHTGTSGTAETANQHRRLHLPRRTNGPKSRLRLPELT